MFVRAGRCASGWRGIAGEGHRTTIATGVSGETTGGAIVGRRAATTGATTAATTGVAETEEAETAVVATMTWIATAADVSSARTGGTSAGSIAPSCASDAAAASAKTSGARHLHFPGLGREGRLLVRA